MNPLYLADSAASYFKAKQALRSFDKMTAEEVRRQNLLRIKKTVDYCWKNVPFYRKLWGTAGIKPGDIRSLSDFERLPMIDRNDIIAACEDFVPEHYPRQKLSMITTGGTTGMPMKFYIDNFKARGKEVAFVGHINRKYFGCKPFDREILLRGDRVVDDKAQARGKFWKYSYLRQALMLSSFHIVQENMSSYMSVIRKYDPHVIKAYPSSIVALCQLMKRNGEKPFSSLRAVICSSENVADAQRKLVREVLGVEIYSFYGHSEKCVVAFQSESGNMFFHPLYGFTEFVSADGSVVTQPGAMAEVVVTGFDHDYFPLVRYRTNDIIEVGEPDGLFEKTAVRIIGREQDFVYDGKWNKIIFTNHDEPFWDVQGLQAYQYVQDEPGKLVVKLQVAEDYDAASEDIMLKDMSEIFPEFEIDFRYKEDIPKTPRGKFKYLVQNLKP